MPPAPLAESSTTSAPLSTPARARRHKRFSLRKLRKLIWFVRYFSNWPEVWAAYRRRECLPALYVRPGVILAHGENDDPLYAFREIFERREYLGDGFYVPLSSHTVVDIGANNGFFAMYLQGCAPGIRVHCFEPGTEARRWLCENVALNNCGSQVSIYPYAIGDSEGVRYLRKDANSMLRSLALNSSEAQDADAVQTITLGHALELCGPGPINLLKIDIEGGEVELIQGATRCAWERVEKVVAEVHEAERPGCGRMLREALAAAGFRHIEAMQHPPGNEILRAGR